MPQKQLGVADAMIEAEQTVLLPDARVGDQ